MRHCPSARLSASVLGRISPFGQLQKGHFLLLHFITSSRLKELLPNAALPPMLKLTSGYLMDTQHLSLELQTRACISY